MDSIRQKIVTAKSMEPPPFQAGESESIPGMATDDGQLRLQRYAQIMERLQQEADEVGSDVMVTVQDREVSLAQSKLAEEVEAAPQISRPAARRSSSAPASAAATGSAGSGA